MAKRSLVLWIDAQGETCGQCSFVKRRAYGLAVTADCLLFNKVLFQHSGAGADEDYYLRADLCKIAEAKL